MNTVTITALANDKTMQIKRAHIISVGLEARRSLSFLQRDGTDFVVVMWFTPKDRKEALSEHLTAHKQKVRDILAERGVSSEELEVNTFELSVISKALKSKVDELKRRGFNRVTLVLSTGHTMFKLAGYIVGCFDSSIRLAYGDVNRYIASEIASLADLEIQDNAAPLQSIPKETSSLLRKIAKLAAEGHTGNIVEIHDIPKLPVPFLEERELDVLEMIQDANGEIDGIQQLAMQILTSPTATRFGFKQLVKKRGRAATAAKREARRLATQLSRNELRNLKAKAYIEMEKKTRNSLVRLTSSGQLAVTLLR